MICCLASAACPLRDTAAPLAAWAGGKERRFPSRFFPCEKAVTEDTRQRCKEAGMIIRICGTRCAAPGRSLYG